MRSLGLYRCDFQFRIEVFEIFITASINQSYDCWIQLFLTENGKTIIFARDSRFYNLNAFRKMFSGKHGDLGYAQVENPKFAANQLCDIIENITRISKIKYFW